MDQANFFQTSPLGQAGTSLPVPPSLHGPGHIGNRFRDGDSESIGVQTSAIKVTLSLSRLQGFTQARHRIGRTAGFFGDGGKGVDSAPGIPCH